MNRIRLSSAMNAAWSRNFFAFLIKSSLSAYLTQIIQWGIQHWPLTIGLTRGKYPTSLLQAHMPLLQSNFGVGDVGGNLSSIRAIITLKNCVSLSVSQRCHLGSVIANGPPQVPNSNELCKHGCHELNQSRCRVQNVMEPPCPHFRAAQLSYASHPVWCIQ